MHAGTRGTCWWCLVVVLAVLVAGCTANAGSSVREVAVTTRNGCPTAYPERLVLTANASEATPPLGDMRACTKDPATGPVLLFAGGRAAWQVLPGASTSRVLGGGRWTHWLRSRVAVPATVVLPGQSALVWAPARAVGFRVNRDWSVAWASLSAGLRTLPTTGHDSRATAARSGSARGRALVTCALTALHLRRTPTLVGAAPASPSTVASTPYGATPAPATSPPTGAAPGGQEPRLRGMTGMDALQATWDPSTTACSEDWQHGDRRLDAGSGSAVRWWTAWQRADDWLARVAGDLQWLDHDGVVTLRVRS